MSFQPYAKLSPVGSRRKLSTMPASLFMGIEKKCSKSLWAGFCSLKIVAVQATVVKVMLLLLYVRMGYY